MPILDDTFGSDGSANRERRGSAAVLPETSRHTAGDINPVHADLEIEGLQDETHKALISQWRNGGLIDVAPPRTPAGPPRRPPAGPLCAVPVGAHAAARLGHRHARSRSTYRRLRQAFEQVDTA